jgi:site-specific recombinase XerD
MAPEQVDEITHRHVRRYLSHLAEQGRCGATIQRKLTSLRSFFKFLLERGEIEVMPTLGIRRRSSPRQIPRPLSFNEAKRLVESPRLTTAAGRRDRALLEWMYSTGARSSETAGMDLSRLFLDRGIAHVIGKGNKERQVVVGRHAVRELRRYLEDPLRPKPTRDAGDALFLNPSGNRLSVGALGPILRKHTSRAGIHYHITPHTLRHTFATHLIERGANLVLVMKLLGHVSLSSTQLYTRISAERLRAVYKRSHPWGEVFMSTQSLRRRARRSPE